MDEAWLFLMNPRRSVLLLERSYRFSELAYLIGGVSEKMLAQTLRRLEMDDFVRREVHATKFPTVEYSVRMGEHLQAQMHFVNKNASRVLKNRENTRKHVRRSLTRFGGDSLTRICVSYALLTSFRLAISTWPI